MVGFGNQGAAQALNLRDSGIEVVVGARPGSAGAAAATREGFEVRTAAAAAAGAALVILAVPDHIQPELCRSEVMPAMDRGAALGFLHGYALRFGGLVPRPDLAAVLVAPKGPGATLRQRYLEGRGIPCLLAIQQEGTGRDAESIGLAWASAIGCGRAGIVRTTVAHETETDLFGEQAVLCGGAIGLARAGFEALVHAGYPPELAYVECIHELKQVVDLLFEHGIEGMYRRVSGTAEFGGRRAAERLIDESLRERLGALLAEVRDGRFAAAMDADAAAGFPWLNARRAAGSADPVESAGRAVRRWMPWLAQSTDADSTGP